MPTPFIEARFPPNISYGSKGGPGFSTTIFTADSGSEQRNINWQDARARYDVSHGIKNVDDMDTILAFFYNVRGMAIGFRYKDWADYQLVNEQIGVGDGAETEFQITKTYTVDTETYVRDIKKIVSDPIPVVKVDGVTQVLSTDYTLDVNTGVITFAAPVADTKPITVTCEFDVPVRFDTDNMEITQEAWQLETWDSIPLVELKV